MSSKKNCKTYEIMVSENSICYDTEGKAQIRPFHNSNAGVVTESGGNQLGFSTDTGSYQVVERTKLVTDPKRKF